MQKRRAGTSARGTWRQQQMVAAAMEQATAQPTLAMRSILLQARLTALFATYGQQLASDVSTSAATATVAGAASSRPKTALAVVQYLRQLEAADGWHGVNRALLHGLLHAAWASSSGLQKPAASPADEWAVDSDWRLSTGSYVYIVRGMGWEDLLVHALCWTPGPAAAAAALSPLLLPSDPSHASSLLLAGMGADTPAAVAELSESGDLPVTGTGRPSGSRSLLQAALRLQTAAQPQQPECLQAGQQTQLLCHTAHLAAECLAQCELARAHDEGAGQAPTAAGAASTAADLRGAVTAACSALHELLTAWPELLSGVLSSGACSSESQSASSAVCDTDLQSQLRLIAAQLQRAVTPLAQQMADDSVEADEPTRQSFQALTHLRTRLALLGVLPLADEVAAAVILRAFPQDVHRSGTQPASATESQQQLAPTGSPPQQPAPPPDWKAALLAGGRRRSSAALCSGGVTAAGTANAPAKPQSSLCEQLLAELLLRAMPDRQCASWPVQQALQAFLAAGQQPAAAAMPQQRVAACSPLALAAAALSLLAQLAEAPGPPAGAAVVQPIIPEQAAGPADEGPERAGSSGNAAAWSVLCRVFASVAAEVSAPQQQRALLRLCLEAEALAGVRQRLEASQELQQESAAALVAISNQMVQGEEEGSRVFGDDAAEAAMTQAVLPWACLAPAAVLRRLFADAALHRSQAPLVMAVLRQLQPAAVMQQSDCALPLGVVCLRDALAASAHHLRSEAAAPGFLAMAAAAVDGPAAAHEGGAPIVDPRAVLDHLVLPSLLQRGAAGPTAAAAAAAAELPAGSSGTMCDPASDSQLPVGFALALGIAMVDALPSPVQQQPAGQPRFSAAVSSAEPAAADGVLGGATAQPFTWHADEMLLAVCRLLDARPAVYSAAGGVTAAALQLAERLACLLAAAPGAAASKRVADAATTLTWRTRLTIAPLLVAAAQLSGDSSSKATNRGMAAQNRWSDSADENTAAMPVPLLTPPVLRALPAGLDGHGNIADAVARHSLKLANCAARGSAISGACDTAALAGSAEAALHDGLLLCASSDELAHQFAACCLALAGPSQAQDTLRDGTAAAPAFLGALGSLAPHAAGLALLISGSRVETPRRALLRSCAQLLPSMTPAEAARVLHVALPRLLAVFLTHSASSPLPQGNASECLAALRGATLELLCRSLAAVGQQMPSPGSDIAWAAGPEHAVVQPDPQQQQRLHQQQEAFDALLVHISAYCHTLTAPATGLSNAAMNTALESPASAELAADGQVADAHSKQKEAASEAAADAGSDGADGSALLPPQLAVLLAQRAFGELAAAATAAAAEGFACSRAQTLLLHLLKVCCQQPLWRIGGSNTAGSDSTKASDPTCWRTAEGFRYMALLAWLRGHIGDSCPGAGTLRFGIHKLAGDHLAALTP